MLHAIGRVNERPVPPLNLVGDFGGGSMFLLVGILSALWERQSSGKGQVVDAAMVDGSSVLVQMMWALRDMGMWSDVRGTNMLDAGAPYYDTYEMRRRPLCRRRRHRAAVLRRPAGRARAGRCRPARPERHRALARTARGADGGVRRPRPRPLGQGVRRHRRLRDAGAGVRRGGDRAAQHRARYLLQARAARLFPAPAPRFSRTVPDRAASTRASREPTTKQFSATGYSPQPTSRSTLPKGKTRVEIKDAVAVVTGGASGLGLATTKRLLDAGRRSSCSTSGVKTWSPNSARVRDSRRPMSPTEAAVAPRSTSPRRWARCASSSTAPAPATRSRSGQGRRLPAGLRSTHVVDVNLIGTFNVLRLAAERIAKTEPSARSAASSSTPPRWPPSTARSARPPTRRPRAAWSA